MKGKSAESSTELTSVSRNTRMETYFHDLIRDLLASTAQYDERRICIPDWLIRQLDSTSEVSVCRLRSRLWATRSSPVGKNVSSTLLNSRPCPHRLTFSCNRLSEISNPRQLAAYWYLQFKTVAMRRHLGGSGYRFQT